MQIFNVPYNQLQITLADFSSVFRDDSDVGMLQEELTDVISKGEKIIHTQGIIQIFDDIEWNKGYFNIGRTTFECGRKITHQLRYAEKLTVFVCTAGVGTTDQYKQYMEQNELLKAYFVDMMGTIAVEKAMDIIQQKLAADLLSDSLKITNRYSPGYCGWLVKEQSKLFSLLPENPCGVTLTSSSLMIPSKSISGVIGIGKEVRFSQYECQLCEMKTCLYRKKHIKSSK